MENNKKIIGYFQGDAFMIDENGNVIIESRLAERINRRVSEINKELNHVTKLYQFYIKKQVRVKELLGKKAVQLSELEKRHVQRTIEKNRIILRGMATYISKLKSEKSIIQKNHPKNMKKSGKQE